jgi:hypothetical protein
MNKGLGIGAIVLGIIATIFCWIPFCGLGAVPIAAIGLLLAIIGVVISVIGKKPGVGFPASGAVICIIAIAIALVVTSKTASTIHEALKPPALPAVNTSTDSSASAQSPATSIPRLENLITTIPSEFALDETGKWDKFTAPKVQQWIEANLAGKDCEIDSVAQFVSLGGYNPNTDSYTVLLRLAGNPATIFRGKPLGIKLFFDPTGATDQTFTINVDEATARQWDRHKTKRIQQIKIRGKVGTAKFMSQYIFGVELQQPDVSLYDDPDRLLGYCFNMIVSNRLLLRDPDHLLIKKSDKLFDPDWGGPSHPENLGQPRPDGQWSVSPAAGSTLLEKSGDYRLYSATVGLYRIDEQTNKPPELKTQQVLAAIRVHGSYIILTEQVVNLCNAPPTKEQIDGAKKAIGWPNSK